ncbi:MAG: DUF1318 domain-containing protein [Candidatus Omnitrophica bacterium]|nr:DUF1318 domain-containing protein [Candidatus Omnitrophota bacterium]
MKRSITNLLVAVIAVVFVMGVLPACKVETVGDAKRPIVIEAHITLDIRGLEGTASKIEDMVGEGVSKDLPLPPPKEKITNPLGPSEAHAETSYDLRYPTPETERALNNRRARFRDLAYYMSQGSIGEGIDGHVAKLGGGPEIDTIVNDENRDREVIYSAIVEQNKLPADAIKTVRMVFGKVQSDRAVSGTYIQQDNGKWVKK